MYRGFARISPLAVLAALALSSVSGVQATPVTWVTNGFTFSDGSYLVGGITYDAAKNTYSDSLIFAFGGRTSRDVAFPYWNTSYPVLPSFIALVEGQPGSDLTGFSSLFITLATSLAEPGLSTILSPVALEARCLDPLCSSVDQSSSAAAFRGEMLYAPAPVPEPSGLLTLSAAFLSLIMGWKAVQRKRAA